MFVIIIKKVKKNWTNWDIKFNFLSFFPILLQIFSFNKYKFFSKKCECNITDSIPGVGGDKEEDSGQTKEELQEQERMRQEAIKEAERERRIKYKKQEEERENIRAGIREKVRIPN